MRALFVVVLGAMLATAASASCSYHSTCYGCTTANSGDCGWDANSQVCEAGSSNGPTGYATTPVSWFWVAADCCSQYSSCSTCTEASRCGWNTASLTCEYGTSSGPQNQVSDNWAWDNYQCSAQGGSSSNQYCDFNWDCSACIDTAGCGWADDQDTCMSGNSYGPTGLGDYSDDWKYYNCNTAWTWRFSASSASMWITWSVLVVFFMCCGACCRARRRRVAVVAVTGTTAANAPLMNAQYGQQQPAYGQPAYGTQPAPPAYGSPQPGNAAQPDLYGPSKYENCQAENV